MLATTYQSEAVTNGGVSTRMLVENRLSEKDLGVLVYRGPYLECCVQFWALQYKRDMDILESVQQRTVKVMKVLKHPSYEKRLRELRLISLEQRKLRGICSMCINT